ncbi:hypothetical protein AXF42_Ash018232 [Apostasia shenzhenica]|uniref:RING-type domain-containing protein n=1 Tax=Apostasia shenzhenica TaxID=1088818 RepID=A0A2I0B1F6_9ASPA|nr:hypothetical protein AXF42_Ash018232 [Apostasia shenzhenica]
MDLEKPDLSGDSRGSASASCSICLELVLDRGERSIAKLQCGHEFHLGDDSSPFMTNSLLICFWRLNAPGRFACDADACYGAKTRSVVPRAYTLFKLWRGSSSSGWNYPYSRDCIGSAFNAKGAMQCPNCRKVEKGRWLFATGNRSSTDFDFDGWISEDIYDFSYSELPFGFQWCPFGGFTQLASLFEDVESQPNSYHEPLGSGTFRDHSSSTGGTHVCPYLAGLGFPHSTHAAPSSSSDSVPENTPFHRHSQTSAEILNPHSFSATQPQNHNWQQQPPSNSVPLVGNSDQPTAQFGLRLPRNDTTNQQRLGSFVHSRPLIHGSVAARSASNVVAPSIGPQIIGEVRGHSRGHGAHIYPQSVSSSSLRNSTFPPARRSRPRGLTLISTSASPETGGFYGISLSSSTSRSLQDAGRHYDRFYGWGRESFVTPLPWIPVEGESHWWGPFNPNQTSQAGSLLQRGGAAVERAQNRSENGYHQRIPPPTRMPPPPPPPSFM